MTTLSATFPTRRDAELAIERLVQEFKIDRKAIRVGPQGDENSAGEAPSGADKKAAEPSPEARDDGALEGAILVEVDGVDGDNAAAVRSAFAEFSEN